MSSQAVEDELSVIGRPRHDQSESSSEFALVSCYRVSEDVIRIEIRHRNPEALRWSRLSNLRCSSSRRIERYDRTGLDFDGLGRASACSHEQQCNDRGWIYLNGSKQFHG